jgi:predicted ThiF/HesA family dinucleotide-utilizing enzyme
MSPPLTSRDPNLQRLLNEGFDLEVRSARLLVHSVPYVDANRQVHTDGVLVMALAGESSTVPPDHTAHFIGEHPCDMGGARLQFQNPSGRQELAPGLVVDHCFSAKPSTPYANFYEKVKLYVEMISGPARAMRPEVTACTFKPVPMEEDQSVFLYMDTATTRAGIDVATSRYHGLRLAIVGLGGTGAYVLDQVAKTPVVEIHLFDGDTAFQHNAFRFPGAMSLDELTAAPKKVKYLQAVYAGMRRGIVAHPEMITADNVEVLKSFDHVFVCVDKGSVRQLIVDALRGTRTQIFDVGMGLHLNEETQQVFGICRVTTVNAERNNDAERFIPMVDADEEGIYRSNVQIADLNALNASLAVVLWKKAVGFYADLEEQYHMAYTIATNSITAEGAPCEG